MITVKEYRDLKMISQSSLKLLDYSPLKFYNYEYKWLTGEGERSEQPANAGMKMGSLVDCKLFTPEEFDNTYIVSNVQHPTGQMLTFTDNFYEEEKKLSAELGRPVNKDEVRQIAEKAYAFTGFKRDSLDNVFERFGKEAFEYYKFLKQSEGKIILSKGENTEADELIEAAKKDEYISKILEPGDGFEVIKQLPVTGIFSAGNEYCEIVKLKGLLDLVVIDHKTKSIHPFDLKTTGDSNFIQSYNNWRYDLQGAFYTYLLKIWKSEQKYKDYYVTPFTFIVIYTSGVKAPELYEMSGDQLDLGKLGGLNSSGKYVRGFSQILADYVWHKQTGKWNYTKEVYENNGRRIII